MPTMTEERPAKADSPAHEVVVRVDGGRRRRSPVLTVLAIGALAVVLVVGIATAGGLLDLRDLFTSRTTDRSAPVIVHKLRDLSSYRAASGTFSVAVDVEKDVSILPQFLAGSRVIYSGYGTVDATVDLGALDARRVTQGPDGDLVVTLPHARLAGAVLDPAHSHVMNRDRGLLDRVGGIFVDSPTSERALERAAVTKMDAAAAKTGLVTRAERNTAAMVRRVASAVGVDQVQVRFA